MIACLIPLLSNWRSMHTAGRPIVLVSLCAYALYLVHMPVLYLFQQGAVNARGGSSWRAAAECSWRDSMGPRAANRDARALS